MKNGSFKTLIVSLPLLITMFLIPSHPFAEESYSLQQVLRMASERAERLRLAEEDLFIVQLQKDKAEAALIPKLSLYGSYTRYSEDRYSVGNMLLQPEQSYAYGIRLDQSYSLGGREFKLHEISRGNIEKGRLDILTIRQEYLMNVATAFYEVLRMRRYVEIARSNLERLQRHRDAAAIRLKVGEVTKTALLRAEAELSGAKTELIKAENGLSLAKAILARLAGIEGPFTLNEPEQTSDLDILDLQALKAEALERRSEVRSALIQHRLSVEQIKVAEAAYYPSLSLEAVYNRADMSPASLNLVKETLYGGIKVTFPLYEGGQRRAEVKEAETKMRQALLQIEDIKKAVSVEVERAYLEFVTYKNSLRSNEAQVAFARDNYNAVSRQFEHGLANSLDVMDANNLLVSSEQRLAETTYNLRLSHLKIKRAVGRELQ
jgi:outer membrane protein